MKRATRSEGSSSASDEWHAYETRTTIFLDSVPNEPALTLYLEKKAKSYGIVARVQSHDAAGALLNDHVGYAQLDSNALGRFAWIDNVEVDESVRGRGLCQKMITHLVHFFVTHGGLYFSGEFRTATNEVMPKRAFFLIEIVTPVPFAARTCYLKSMRTNHYVFVPDEKKDGLFYSTSDKKTYRLPHATEEEAFAFYGPERYCEVKHFPKYNYDEMFQLWHEPLQFHVDGYEGKMPLDVLAKIDVQERRARDIVYRGDPQRRWWWLRKEIADDVQMEMEVEEEVQDEDAGGSESSGLPPRPTAPVVAKRDALPTAGKEEKQCSSSSGGGGQNVAELARTIESMPPLVAQTLLEYMDVGSEAEIERLKRVHPTWRAAIESLHRGLAVPRETQEPVHFPAGGTVKVATGFWEKVAKDCFVGVQELPHDLQAKLDNGVYKYSDQAWYEHYRRTWKWIFGFTVLAIDEEAKETTSIQRATKLRDMNCDYINRLPIMYYKKERKSEKEEKTQIVKLRAYFGDLHDEIFESRGGVVYRDLHISVQFDGVEFYHVHRPEEGISTQLRYKNENAVRRMIYYDFTGDFYGDYEKFKEYAKTEAYSYETVPDFFEDFKLRVTIQWDLLTPNLCASIQERIDQVRGGVGQKRKLNE